MSAKSSFCAGDNVRYWRETVVGLPSIKPQRRRRTSGSGNGARDRCRG